MKRKKNEKEKRGKKEEEKEERREEVYLNFGLFTDVKFKSRLFRL